MEKERFQVLDGWRGLSILFVLTCHLLPVGPAFLHINNALGKLGMVLFFTLSGFLVTHFLISRPNVVDFLIRRFLRILPLAWLYILVALLLNPVSRDAWMAHLFFYANYPPKPLIDVTDHLWSLCVEMHFYLGLALIVSLFKKKGLMLIPIICLFITMLRVIYTQYYNVVTHFRVDEVLAGATLALIYNRQLGNELIKFLSKVNYVYILLLLFIACHEDTGFMNYFRPYLAATLVGATLFNQKTRLTKVLEHKWLFYIASISYALYVIHPLMASTWLGSGDTIEKYAKRPLLFAVVFLMAHISTFYYEHPVMAWGKTASKKFKMLRRE
ncbi:MAG: acyltransferase [Methylotenera sp.]|uniref:acyltransferase family protein n=1 Tax=Methylotenera sp. TaxID=2051956 RepID=UPI002488023F|nr:acyltransferase [Methylotenera sp.]MDI1310113.1 acyltransferase [Methylotenera sp.]